MLRPAPAVLLGALIGTELVVGISGCAVWIFTAGASPLRSAPQA